MPALFGICPDLDLSPKDLFAKSLEFVTDFLATQLGVSVVEILQAERNVGGNIQARSFASEKPCMPGGGDHRGVVGGEVFRREVDRNA